MAKVLIVDNRAGDWRRVYVDGALEREGHPNRINYPAVIRSAGVEIVCEVIEAFEMVDDE